MAKKINITSDAFNEILLYTTPNGKVKVEIYLQNETIWLTQQKIADLFGVEKSGLSMCKNCTCCYLLKNQQNSLTIHPSILSTHSLLQ